MYKNTLRRAHIVTMSFLILYMCSCQSETQTQTQTQTANTSVVDEHQNDSLQGSELALLDLSAVNELRDTFLKDSGHVRLVALMSPT